MDDLGLDRIGNLTELLFQGVDVVVCQEAGPDPRDEIWIAGSRQIYHVQQGRNPREAKIAWMRCFLLTVIAQGNPKMATHKPMPNKVWAELTSRSSAVVERARFSFDVNW